MPGMVKASGAPAMFHRTGGLKACQQLAASSLPVHPSDLFAESLHPRRSSTLYHDPRMKVKL